MSTDLYPETTTSGGRAVLPAPICGEGEVAERCHKCNGTGFYCMGTENGKPFSFTGFDCHPCGGSGWFVKTLEAIEKSRKRAERAMEPRKEEIEQERFARTVLIEEIKEIVADLVPRATAIYGELKEGSEAQRNVGEFLLRASAFTTNPEGYIGEYGVHPKFVSESVAPVVVRWEEIIKDREEKAKTCQYLGAPGDKLTLEAKVVFTKSFEGQFGERHLTILEDAHGNQIKYWNTFSFVDPIETEANGGNESMRNVRKGDVIRFTCSVKHHDEYKGVKGTVIQRARKISLIEAGPV